MLVASHVVVVKVDEALGGLLHCGHLDQSHFAVPAERHTVARHGVKERVTSERRSETHRDAVRHIEMQLDAADFRYVLEKLESFDGAASVGEEQPQVLLRHILTVGVKRQIALG